MSDEEEPTAWCFGSGHEPFAFGTPTNPGFGSGTHGPVGHGSAAPISCTALQRPQFYGFWGDMDLGGLEFGDFLYPFESVDCNTSSVTHHFEKVYTNPRTSLGGKYLLFDTVEMKFEDGCLVEQNAIGTVRVPACRSECPEDCVPPPPPIVTDCCTIPARLYFQSSDFDPSQGCECYSGNPAIVLDYTVSPSPPPGYPDFGGTPYHWWGTGFACGYRIYIGFDCHSRNPGTGVVFFSCKVIYEEPCTTGGGSGGNVTGSGECDPLYFFAQGAVFFENECGCGTDPDGNGIIGWQYTITA